MKRSAGFITLALLVLFPAIIQAETSVYPLGTTIYKPDKCWNGFTILSSEEGRLVDMNGNLAHLWKGKLHHPNKEVVWEYSPNTSNNPGQGFGHKLYSVNVSSAQRLPNGNTLINEGAQGRIIEVTADYEIVWEYMNPYMRDSDIPFTRTWFIEPIASPMTGYRNCQNRKNPP